MKNMVLVSGANFGISQGGIDIRRPRFIGDVSKSLREILKQQFEDFNRLDSIEYNSSYKLEYGECYRISNYAEQDGTFSSFIEMQNGTVRNTLRFDDDLEGCRSLMFAMPEFPELIFVQRFNKGYLAQPSRWFHFADTNAIQRIDKIAFTIPSSLTGVYDTGRKILRFKSLQSIRAAIPDFSDEYVPEADLETVKAFFSKSHFDPESSESLGALDSVKIRRLVWLLKDEDISERMHQFRYFNDKLNLNSIKMGRIVLSKKVGQMEVILRILLGDVFEDRGKVYLSNSKRLIEKFD